MTTILCRGDNLGEDNKQDARGDGRPTGDTACPDKRWTLRSNA